MSLPPPRPTPTCPDCDSKAGVRRHTDPLVDAEYRCGPCGRNFDRRRVTVTRESPTARYTDAEPAPQNRVVPYLRDHGPSTLDALPVKRVADHARQRFGVRRVLISLKSHGWGTAVYYLPEHDPAAVVDAVLDANPRLRDLPTHTVSQQLKGHDAALADAYRERANDAGGASP